MSPSLSLRLSPERKHKPEACIRCCCIPCRCCCRCCCFPCCCYINCCKALYRSDSGNNSLKNNPINSSYNQENTYHSPNQNSQNFNSNFERSEPPQKEYNPNEKEENEFGEFLSLLMAQESQIENEKISLAICHDLNVEDVFRLFEVPCRGYLTCDDLISGLCCLGLEISREDARILMQRFDLQKCGVLSYQDFFDLLVPYEKDYRGLVERRRPASCCGCRSLDGISPETREKLKSLFCSILEKEREVNELRKKLVMLRVKLPQIYPQIDRLNLGYFINSDFVSFLKEKKIFSTMREADLLFIRLDRNRNGKIEEYEIKDELDPKY